MQDRVLRVQVLDQLVAEHQVERALRNRQLVAVVDHELEVLGRALPRAALVRYVDAGHRGDPTTQLQAEATVAWRELGDSPVLVAMYHGHPDIAEFLVGCGAELNIFEASAFGDEFAVADLLCEDQKLLNTYSHDGWTPLHLAAFFGHYDVAEVLLLNGADTELSSKNTQCAHENTALHAAITNRKTGVVQLLLGQGANVNASDGDDRMPLHVAAHHGDTELVELLLANGADVNAQMEDGTPLANAENAGHTETAALLRQHGGKA